MVINVRGGIIWQLEHQGSITGHMWSVTEEREYERCTHSMTRARDGLANSGQGSRKGVI